MQAKVSVIIPVHNTANYLHQCLESVCSQTLRELEIICINDCSTDSSGQILRSFSQQDERIKIITFEKNRGVSAARNAGLDAATGQYVGFVDSDDRINLDFYRLLYDQAADETDIIKGEIRYIVKGKPQPDVFLDCFGSNRKIRENRGYFFHFFFSAIYRRAFLSQHHIRFYEDLCYAEDLCFNAAAVCYCNSCKCVDGAMYDYVQHSASATHTTSNKRFLLLRSLIISIDKILQTANSVPMDMQVYCAQICRMLAHLRLSFHETELDLAIETQWENYILKNAKYPENILLMLQQDLFAYYGANRRYIFQQLRNNIQQNEVRNSTLKG